MAKSNCLDVLRVVRRESRDEYRGTAQILLAAGVIEPQHLPGECGNKPHAQTFFEGRRASQRLPAGSRDERYMCVMRCGRGLVVWKGLSEQERDRRRWGFDLQGARREREQTDREMLAPRLALARGDATFQAWLRNMDDWQG